MPFQLMNEPWVIPFILFIILFLFCIGVYQVIRQRAIRRRVVAKIRGADGSYDAPTADDSFGADGPSPILKAVGRVGAINPALGKNMDPSHGRLKFLRAGIRADNAPAVFWGAKILLTFFLPAAFALLRAGVFTLMSQQATIAIGIFLALLGFYLPDLWLKQKSDTRREKILVALPDALDLLVICVEAGMGIDGAINRVAEEMQMSNPELADELRFMNLELRAGKQRQEALRSFAQRTNLEEVNSLATLLIQTDKFGTSMADALRVYADSYRTARYQKAEELAAKLPVKLVFPLVAFIFPALFVVLLGPAAISIYKALMLK
jgi:tight adherence protein C